MEQSELLRRAEDLAGQCERRSVVTATTFLTPLEQTQVRAWAARRADVTLYFSGGGAGCERCAAFFLPYYQEAESFDASEYIHAVRIQSYFGEPGHRDYMGAALGLGIRREWLGDFRVEGAAAWVFCLPSVERVLTGELEKVGRFAVKAAACPLDEVPAPERRVKELSFTVKSLRLDALSACLFSLSRTAAAEAIRAGLVSLNYEACDRVDAAVKEGDVISLRAHGKGTITEVGGKSRKDRLFISAELLL